MSLGSGDFANDRASHRDLHKLGDYLINKHREAIVAAGMDGKAEVGEMPFHWETDFEFIEFGGWKANQEGSEYERNILVIIPGKTAGRQSSWPIIMIRPTWAMCLTVPGRQRGEVIGCRG